MTKIVSTTSKKKTNLFQEPILSIKEHNLHKNNSKLTTPNEVRTPMKLYFYRTFFEFYVLMMSSKRG